MVNGAEQGGIQELNTEGLKERIWDCNIKCYFFDKINEGSYGLQLYYKKLAIYIHCKK